MNVRQQCCSRLVAAAIAAWPGISTAQNSQPSGSTLSADVIVESSIVDEKGVVVESRPTTRYRMTVRMVNGRRETEIVYPQARLFPRGPLVDPRSGYRTVVDDELQNLRVYDSSGALVVGTDTAASADRGVDAATLAPGLVFTDSDALSRKRDLSRRFGRAAGKVSGRDRYLVQHADSTTEAIAEPSTQLPVQFNVMRNGTLQQQTSITYARMPRGRWHLATERDEIALPGTNRRSVTLRTYLNVVANGQ